MEHQDPYQRYTDLVEPHFDDLMRFALWLTRDRGAAEEVVQETLLRAWRSLDQLKEGAAAKPWLLTTLRRENARRFERRRLNTIELDAHPVSDDRPGPDERMLRSQVRTAVDRLPSAYRDPLNLQVFAGCSIAEVAVRLNLSESAVMTRVFRARRKIHDRLAAA